jgi:putative Mg2+ transporter-C (MgtC) family protein
MGGLLDIFDPSTLRLLGSLGLAAVLGGVIGLERELSGKPAGFRTNLLICVGAALLTNLSIRVAGLATPGMNADPARIAAQIVSGIGFLGAGTIIQSRGSVHGLTTAATLWVVAAIGMAVGSGSYIEASLTTFLVLVALVALGWVEGRFLPEHGRILRVTTDAEPGVLGRVQTALLEAGLNVEITEVERQDSRIFAAFEVTGRARDWQGVVESVAGIDGVRKVHRP